VADVSRGEKVTVMVAQGDLEANLYRSLLESHGIPVSVAGESVRGIYGFTMDGLGAAPLMVPADRAEEARHLVEAARRGDLELPGDDDG
jgi:hypothetical protein